MLKAKTLSNLLAQTLSDDIQIAFLFSSNGSLLAQASGIPDQRRSRVVAAIAARMWNTSMGLDDELDNGRALKGDDWLCVDLKSWKLLMQNIEVPADHASSIADGLLVGIQGAPHASLLVLRQEAQAVKDYLTSEFSKLDTTTNGFAATV